MFTDSEAYHAWADTQPEDVLPADPWSVSYDGEPSPSRADTADEVWPADGACEGDPVSSRAGGEPGAVAPPVVGGRVGGDAQVAVAVADEGVVVAHGPSIRDHAMAQLDITASRNHTNLPKTPRAGRNDYTTSQPVKPGTAYARRRRAGLADGTWRGYVNPDRARTHITRLRDAGLSAEAIAELSGLPRPTIGPLIWATSRHRGHILGTTEDAVLAIRIDYRRINPTRIVSAVGAVRRLQALAVMGWPVPLLAAKAGVTVTAVSRWRRSSRLAAATVVQVMDWYDELAMMYGPSTITRTRALRAGWAPPLAWDDDSIDDPAARPDTGAAGSSVASLAQVVEMLGDGDTIETVARRLDVTEEAIVTACRRNGTTAQRARIAQACAEMRDIRLSLAS